MDSPSQTYMKWPLEHYTHLFIIYGSGSYVYNVYSENAELELYVEPQNSQNELTYLFQKSVVRTTYVSLSLTFPHVHCLSKLSFNYVSPEKNVQDLKMPICLQLE